MYKRINKETYKIVSPRATFSKRLFVADARLYFLISVHLFRHYCQAPHAGGAMSPLLHHRCLASEARHRRLMEPNVLVKVVSRNTHPPVLSDWDRGYGQLQEVGRDWDVNRLARGMRRRIMKSDEVPSSQHA